MVLSLNLNLTHELELEKGLMSLRRFVGLIGSCKSEAIVRLLNCRIVL